MELLVGAGKLHLFYGILITTITTFFPLTSARQFNEEPGATANRTDLQFHHASFREQRTSRQMAKLRYLPAKRIRTTRILEPWQLR
jgi:hypothetical protein